MGEPARKIPATEREWFDTSLAADYLCIFTPKGEPSANAVLKLVERGHLKPDTPAGTGRIRGHRFRRATLDAFLASGGGGGEEE